jgi:hypothetical protein
MIFNAFLMHIYTYEEGARGKADKCSAQHIGETEGNF